MGASHTGFEMDDHLRDLAKTLYERRNEAVRVRSETASARTIPSAPAH